MKKLTHALAVFTIVFAFIGVLAIVNAFENDGIAIPQLALYVSICVGVCALALKVLDD